MKKTVLLSLLFFCVWGLRAQTQQTQNGITFKVEDLTPPDHLLPLTPIDEIYENLILKSEEWNDFDIRENRAEAPFNIVAKSAGPDSLVDGDYHPFFDGMYQAYADHRPFVLSPDMIWLLICQGFARHVQANAEQMRPYFVEHDGKMTLAVIVHNMRLNDPDASWEDVLPEFSRQIAKYTKGDLIAMLSADFSTTTSVEKIAAEITIMESMKAYFDYVIISVVCGIPEITLLGTPEDWQKIVDKTEQLARYQLSWWTDELVPLLKEFVRASRGEVDQDFWRNMFKYHAANQCGSPTIVDGWIVKFFPYDRQGRRNNLEQLSGSSTLPEEIVKVDAEFIEIDSGFEVHTPIELWAGFVGLEQNPENLALTPKIGWMIRKKELKEEWEEGISIRVDEVPEALLGIGLVDRLSIEFINGIRIPDEMGAMEIGNLNLKGEITAAEIRRIKKMFRRTHLVINDRVINDRSPRR